MKKLTKIMLALILTATFVMSSMATTWYVSPNGKKKNSGTNPSEPIKGLHDAISKAAEGDKIFVAAGNYTGQAGCGFIVIDKPLEIYGGYSDDFSTRDIAKYQTTIRPSMDMNATPPKNGTVEFNIDGKPNSKTVFDGFILDHSEVNAYHPNDGKPAGFETGMWLEPPSKGNYPFASLKKYLMYGNTDGNLTISNCLFFNSSL